MDAFSKLHPVAILCYYVVAAAVLIVTAHPFLSFTVFLLSFVTYISFGGVSALIRGAAGSAGAALLCLIVNPLLNHRGVTQLFLLGDVRITWESFCYGGNMAAVLLASLWLFSCFGHYMSSEKIMTLLGRRFPSFSLLFSMILRLVPRAAGDFGELRALHGNRPAVWSALLGITLEESLERSLSMKSRGYGSRKRSSYYRKKFRRQDVFLLFISLSMAGWTAAQYLCGTGVSARFFPSIRLDAPAAWQWGIWIVFFSVPLILRVKEEMIWHLSRRRITGSPTLTEQNTRLQ